MNRTSQVQDSDARLSLVHRQPDQTCTIYRDEQTENGIRVEFDEPQRAVTPGQSVVFYSEKCA
ncbi:MAG: aminomethyltransferase beta-barrel domain-containing protein [Acinetobacter sp.]